MSKATESFYNSFSFLYPLVDVLLKRQKKVLFDAVNSLPDGKLLEIGVGNGAHFKLYQKHQITGIDSSSAMLAIARKNNQANIELVQMDGQALLFSNGHFDYVVLSHVLAVVDGPEELLEEVYRVLRPGGKVFILNHFTPCNWLKYVDRAFAVVSKALRFKSVFYMESISAIRKFTPVKVISFNPASYFKLFVYRKD